MPELTDPRYIKEILSRFGFRFSKRMGQNFLINAQIPAEIVRLSGVTEEWGIIEIGPGIGCLTRELSKHAGKVVSVELDKKLLPVLKETLAGCQNVKVINADILKVNIEELIKQEFPNMPVCVCANLPYYITTPVVMMLLEQCRSISSITVMVQKEVADRLCAEPGSKEAGAITLSVTYYADAENVLNVSPKCFMPSPKVSSSVIKLDILKEHPVNPKDEKFFFKVIKAAFSQRRKTLLNALSATFTDMKKEDIADAIEAVPLPVNIRGERLTLKDFCTLSDLLVH